MSTLSEVNAIAYPLLVTAKIEQTADNRFLLMASGRIFLIGELLFNIIGRLQHGQTLGSVCAEYRQHGLVTLSEEEVDSVLRKYLMPAEQSHLPKRSAYLHTRFDLVGEQVLLKLCQPLLGLFQPQLMAGLLLVSCLLTAAFFYNWGQTLLTSTTENALLCSLVAYAAMIGVVFFHELGHATATYRFGVAPKTIGFGFYMIFPVFFTDVTNVWRLDKRQRIVVNLAGVYFQSLLSILLIGVFYLIPAAHALPRTVIGAVLTTNIFVVFYSLNPFLRNDGYWVYSDFFELPNLMGRSILYPWRLLKVVAPEQTTRPTTFAFPKDLPLLLYSVANYGLFVYLLHLFLGYSSHILVPRLTDLVQQTDFPRNLLTLHNSLFLLKTFGFYGLMSYMTLYSLWRNYNAYKGQRTRLPTVAQSVA